MPHRQTKQTGRRLSPLREYREVNRLRSGLERSFTFRLIRLFSDIANSTADSIDAGGISASQGMYPNILRGVDSVIRQLYAETIQVFSDRAIANRRRAKAVATYEDLFETYIRTQGAQRVRDISLTTQRILQNVIAANSTAGVPVISQAIRERFEPRFIRARATTIARTEIHNASAYATHEQQKSFDAPNMKKQWMANLDGRTRASHAAVSGQQIGMDEDFIVAGKKMAYPGDPRGGPAEVINCRCVLMYIEDEDDILEAPVASEPVNVMRRPKPFTIGQIAVVSKSKSTREMEERFSKATLQYMEGDRDPDLLAVSRFNQTNAADYGRAKTTTMNKESAAISNALLQETDQLAQMLSVPALRGLQGVKGKQIADMGDGVIGIKGSILDDDSRRAFNSQNDPKNPKDLEDNLAKLRVDEDNKMKEAARFGDDKKELIIKYDNTIKKRDGPKLTDSELEDVEKWIAEINSIKREIRRTENDIVRFTPDSWTWGNNLKDRPFSSDAFFSDPLDKIRTTFYHEFGHHVHQQWRVQTVSDYLNPTVEKWMRSIAKKGERKSATRYGDNNEKEWFAENFSLYFMDREDLVDPLFVRLIEAIRNNRDLPNG